MILRRARARGWHAQMADFRAVTAVSGAVIELLRANYLAASQHYQQRARVQDSPRQGFSRNRRQLASRYFSTRSLFLPDPRRPRWRLDVRQANHQIFRGPQGPPGGDQGRASSRKAHRIGSIGMAGIRRRGIVAHPIRALAFANCPSSIERGGNGDHHRSDHPTSPDGSHTRRAR
jgi:hypothetical protein